MPQPDSCCVPSCYRRPKKGLPICEKCWFRASDDERVGLRFSMDAPFFTRWALKDLKAEDLAFVEHGQAVEVVDDRWYGPQVGGGSFASLLHEFEARTTREAIAQAIHDRVWSGLGGTAVEPEHDEISEAVA